MLNLLEYRGPDCLGVRANIPYVGIPSVHHKKVLNYDKDNFFHRGEDEFQTSIEVKDEITYINWYASLCSNIYRNQRYSPYVVLEHIPIEDTTEEYEALVSEAETFCLRDPGATALVNEWIFATTNSKYSWLISREYTCNQNLERLKHHFRECINAFYLLKQEQELSINLTNVCKFLIELDNLLKVYKFVFRENPCLSLILQWIMTSINKNPIENSVLLEDIQVNWERINRDPVFIRHILFSHVKYRKRKDALIYSV